MHPVQTKINVLAIIMANIISRDNRFQSIVMNGKDDIA